MAPTGQSPPARQGRQEYSPPILVQPDVAMQSHGSMRPSFSATTLRAAALAGLGILVGVTINAVRTERIALDRYRPPTTCGGARTPREIAVLQVEQAARLCGDSRALVVDVRDAAAFAEGHIAAGVHLPCSGSPVDLARVRGQLANKTALIVYGETDEQGLQVARDLAGRIDRPDLTVAIIAGGWRAWLDAGLACASGPCDDCAEMLSHATK